MPTAHAYSVYGKDNGINDTFTTLAICSRYCCCMQHLGQASYRCQIVLGCRRHKIRQHSQLL